MSFVWQEFGYARASSVIDMPNRCCYCCCCLAWYPKPFSHNVITERQPNVGDFRTRGPSGRGGVHHFEPRVLQESSHLSFTIFYIDFLALFIINTLISTRIPHLHIECLPVHPIPLAFRI